MSVLHRTELGRGLASPELKVLAEPAEAELVRSLAATNKYLAQSNKSRMRGKATKKCNPATSFISESPIASEIQ